MSVTFTLRGHKNQELNLANANARDLLEWLRVPHDPSLYGVLPAKDLAVLCRRRLWPEFSSRDTGRETVIDQRPGMATIVLGGRDPDYLQRRTRQLLELCEHDLTAEVHFG